jgi:hypothetical protein
LVDETLRAARRVPRPAELRVLRDAGVRRRDEEDDAVLLVLRARAEADFDLLEADFVRVPLVRDRVAERLRLLDVPERRFVRVLRPDLDGIRQSPPYLPLRCSGLR